LEQPGGGGEGRTQPVRHRADPTRAAHRVRGAS
jgi:hypothetical protein